MLREVVTERLHLLIAGSFQIHTRYLVKTNQVDPALQSFEQLDDSPCMLLGIIHTAEDDVFE